jgi:hypothetical protein
MDRPVYPSGGKGVAVGPSHPLFGSGRLTLLKKGKTLVT